MNFPLCDLLSGTLELEPTPEERRRWPSFEDAKRLREDPAADARAPAPAS